MSSQPSISHVDDTSASYRNTDVLLVLLVVSNVVLGGLSIYLLRKYDRDFTRLMDRTLPVLHELRSTGRQGALAYRSLTAALITREPAKRTELLDRATANLTAAHQLRSHVLQSEVVAERPTLVAELRAAGEAYEQTATTLVSRLRAGDDVSLHPAEFDDLRPVFERFASAIADNSDFVEQRSQEIGQEFSRELRGRSTLLLGLATWPALIVIALAVLLAAVVVLFAARRVGIGD